MAAVKRVRIVKKVRESSAWDQRDGCYFLEWWEGPKRRRQVAGQTPGDALEAQRRKRNDLMGERVWGAKGEQALTSKR